MYMAIVSNRPDMVSATRRCQLLDIRNVVWSFMLAAILVLPSTAAFAQQFEVSGGWAHITQEFGTDGFNLGGAVKFVPKWGIGLAFDYDSAYDTSHLATFNTSVLGATSIKSHIQNWLIGPRVGIPLKWAKLRPFGELQSGVTNVKQEVSTVLIEDQSSADTGTSWMFGAGGDYTFNHNWAGRVKLDFLRTHLSDSAQGRLRLGIGLAYTFGRPK